MQFGMQLTVLWGSVGFYAEGDIPLGDDPAGLSVIPQQGGLWEVFCQGQRIEIGLCPFSGVVVVSATDKHGLEA